MPAVNMEAPTGGLNTRDSLDSMPPEDAILMVNWVPETGFVRSRKGYVPYAELLGGPVESMASFVDGTNSILFACVDGNILDITDPANVLTVGSGYASDRWSVQQFGSKMIFMNGVDTPQVYDGDLGTIGDIVITTGPSTISDIFTGTIFKGRMIYAVVDSDSMWYSQAGSYQGDLTEFPLATIFKDGGNLQHVITWSRDAGSGMDDFLVLQSTTGETLVYQGDNPDDIMGWELVQSYRLSEPIGIKRSTSRMASRHVLITSDGYLDLEDSMKGFVSDYNAMSNKIARTVKDAVINYGQNFGWQVVFYPEGNYLLFNVPVETNAQYQQHVMNTRNGNWTTFEGWDSTVFVVHENALYFGTPDGKVRFADFGPNDGGVPIQCSAIPAYSYFGNKQNKKLLTAITLITNHPVPQNISVNGFGDFKEPNLENLIITDLPLGDSWDVAEWDLTSWASSGNTEVNQPAKSIRRAIQGQGWALTVSVRQATNQQQVYWWSHTIEFTETGLK